MLQTLSVSKLGGYTKGFLAFISCLSVTDMGLMAYLVPPSSAFSLELLAFSLLVSL